MQNARERIRLYLATLGGFDPAQIAELTDEALARAQASAGRPLVSRAMEALRTVLQERGLAADERFAERLERLAPGPPIQRTCFAYRPFNKATRAEFRDDRIPHWLWASVRRRFFFAALVAGSAGFAAASLTMMFSDQGLSGLECTITVLFTILFAWIAMGFATALCGLFTLVRKHHPLQATRALATAPEHLPADARVAVVIPVYNEDVGHVFTGLAVMHESLTRTGVGAQFDFFILSDSTDPDHQVAEEAAWARACATLNAAGHLFYRRRRHRAGKKSGNVGDFCRRWGRRYRYMIVLDSDSLMSGPVMVALARIMEARPDIGILQTTPRLIHGATLLGRVQQFASRVYGPLFLAGLHFWQLGDASFWGHNAIVRLEPFLKFCAIPKLRGWLPFGGDILSHDFVEAALMRRAGYGVWLALDFDETYEQPPTTLIAELHRDRRWCRGNMQHLRLVALRGLTAAHRGLFISGGMFYGSSFLWLLLMILCTLRALIEFIHGPNYFPAGRSLFPVWPVHYPWLSWSLLIVTCVLLFLPKLLSLSYLALAGHATRHGGLLRAGLSVALETLVSFLLSPVRMFYHAIYVAASCFGKMDWQIYRWLGRTSLWRDAARNLRTGTIIAVLWGIIVFYVDKTLFWWLSAILIPLAIAIPVAALVSDPAMGQRLRDWGWLLVPEELQVPPVVAAFQTRLAQRPQAHPVLGVPVSDGFALAVVDPWHNRLHCRLLRKTRTAAAPDNHLEDRAVRQGLTALSAAEKRRLLNDPAALRRLHDRIWAAPAGEFDHWPRP